MVKVNPLVFVACFFWFVLMGGQVASASSAVKFIPNEAEYYAFLVNGWRAERPNVLVFKDPFCPYCIKAIPKLPLLTEYNVYVFWAPILGEPSRNRVDDIFNCDTFASQQVLKAVAQRQSPNCNKQNAHPTLRKLNDFVVDNYKVNAVPSFYFQGKNVAFASLLTAQNKRPAINGVNIKWQRFQLMRQNELFSAKTLMMHVPESAEAQLAELMQTYKPEFVFLPDSVLKHHIEFLKCEKQDNSCLTKKLTEYHNKYAEFKLLMGDEINPTALVIFDETGKKIQL